MVVLVFSFPLVWFVSLLCSAALHERDDFQRVGALELRLRTLARGTISPLSSTATRSARRPRCSTSSATVIGVATSSSLPLMIISVPFCMSGPTSAVPAETDVQNCFVGFRASASGESDIHGWYEKRVAEGTVPYEVVRPSVTLITRYSVIANGNEMRLAARTTRLLTAALPASSPRSKLVELPLSLSAPVRLCLYLRAGADKLAPVHVGLVLM